MAIVQETIHEKKKKHLPGSPKMAHGKVLWIPQRDTSIHCTSLRVKGCPRLHCALDADNMMM